MGPTKKYNLEFDKVHCPVDILDTAGGGGGGGFGELSSPIESPTAFPQLNT